VDLDVRAFVNSVYEKAIGATNLQLNKADIIDRCVSRFEKSCYITTSSILEDCEHIRNDDLGLKEDKVIPIKLVNSIYKTIQEMKSRDLDKTGKISSITNHLS